MFTSVTVVIVLQYVHMMNHYISYTPETNLILCINYIPKRKKIKDNEIVR